MQTLTKATCVIFFVAFCFCLAESQKDDNDKLDGLIVTWVPPNVKDPKAFNHWPRTKKEAIEQNCTELENCCQNPSSKYTGIRYLCNNTVDGILIYDKNGYIAGIQMAILKSAGDKQRYYNYQRYPGTPEETILGQKYYVFTTYFINPSKICVGRSNEEFLEQGTVENVYVQNGSNPFTDSIKTPLYGDNSTLYSMGWTEQNCIPSMGVHYTNGFTQDMDCSSFLPVAMMYDETSPTKRLTAIAFIAFASSPNTRLENDPKEAFPLLFKVSPDCLGKAWDQAGGITSWHVYFVKDPLSIPCKDKKQN